MSLQTELYEKLSTIQKERATGRVFVLCREKTRRLNSISIMVKEGEIIDISNTHGGDDRAVGDFWNFPIRTVQFIQLPIPEGVTKNPNVPDMNGLLDRIRGTSGTASGEVAVSEQRTGQLWELSREIDRIIAKKRLDRVLTRGEIGLRAGVLMNIDKNTPDDVSKINRVRVAVKEVLGEDL